MDLLKPKKLKAVNSLQIFEKLFRPGVGGDMEGQNCGQILSVIFRNLHPYRLSNGRLFCLLVMQQKLDPGVPSPALISDFSDPNWRGKMILHIIASNTYF